MYAWRKMTQSQRQSVLDFRQKRKSPWHGPPHYNLRGAHDYHLAAACYEHAPIVGRSPERMAAFESDLLQTLAKVTTKITAWCLLPNHYHVLVQTEDLKSTLHAVGLLHGRTSHGWNGEEEKRGRTCWHRCVDRAIRSEGHFWATVNYIHHNPVRHGYVTRWQD